VNRETVPPAIAKVAPDGNLIPRQTRRFLIEMSLRRQKTGTNGIIEGMNREGIPPAIARIAPDGKLTPRQARQIMIEMVLRRQKPGTGSSLEFLRQRTAMNAWPDLREVLKDIPWVIIGGVATRAYMPERMTKDMDILVSATDAEEVMKRLKAASYTVASRLAVPGYLMLSPEGIELDVLFGTMPWLNVALRHPEYDMAGYPVLGLPYLVLLKLASTRSQDWTDVSRMLGLASKQQLEQVREVVALYRPEDSEDLESFIWMGRRELETPSPDEPPNI
jgi:hypothetical protein